jgi:hypothetical protein
MQKLMNPATAQKVRRSTSHFGMIVSRPAASVRGLFPFERILFMHMRQQLAAVAHIEPLFAARAFHEVIGLCFGDAVGIEAFHD